MNNLDDRVYAAERLIRKRTRRGITEYFVKWRGWGPRHNTWEPESNILDARLIDVYEQNHCKVDHSSRRGNKRKSSQIIKNEPIESDHDDPVNGVETNSHDESEIGKTISENAEEINDEDDSLPDDGETKENGVDIKKRKKAIVSDGESTSSEDTLPLSKRKENSIILKRKESSIGMKRKAEVLSKESGKIGVTITTSPPNGTKHPKSSSPKDVKPSPNVTHIETTNKLYIRKSPATSPRGGGETPVQYQCVSKLSTSKGDTNSKGNLLMTCKTENIVATSAVTKEDNKTIKESKSNTDKKKLENKEKTEEKRQISSVNDSNNNKDKDKKSCNNIEVHNKKDKTNNENNSNNKNNNNNNNINKDKLDNNFDVKDKEQNKATEIHNENNIDTKKETITNGEINNTRKLENIVTNKKNDKNITSKENKEEKKSVIVTTVLKNPGHEYWRLRSPAADKIFITDVTVDLNTVTIRECKTDHGFFRQRDKEEENIENKDTEKSTR